MNRLKIKEIIFLYYNFFYLCTVKNKNIMNIVFDDVCETNVLSSEYRVLSKNDSVYQKNFSNGELCAIEDLIEYVDELFDALEHESTSI
jgi:5-methylthioribose kinase